MKNKILNSPLEGRICHIKVHAHDHVHAGQALLGIRDNQMLHLITASAEADVDKLLVNEGQFVEPGEPLVELDVEAVTDTESAAETADPNNPDSWSLI